MRLWPLVDNVLHTIKTWFECFFVFHRLFWAPTILNCFDLSVIKSIVYLDKLLYISNRELRGSTAYIARICSEEFGTKWFSANSTKSFQIRNVKQSD